VRRLRREEGGFSLVELLVVLVILGVVLAMAGSTLVSMTRAGNRGQALVDNEQNANFALNALARDLRAANPLLAPSSSAVYTTVVQMDLGPSAGPQTVVQWVFDSTAKTLTRNIMSGTTVTSSYLWLTGVLNSSTQPVFGLFDSANNDLVAQAAVPGTVALCTTRVEVQIDGLSEPGPLPFNVVADVQLRNQIANLAAAGGQPCA
jgi:prepilin-type N-terminal cleavage/methylation domain-containing protein